MREEFARFGLARFRVLVGALEVAAGLAQLAHVFAPMLAQLATGGVCLLMILGVITRIRVKDSLWVTAPALAYAALNGWLLFVLMQP